MRSLQKQYAHALRSLEPCQSHDTDCSRPDSAPILTNLVTNLHSYVRISKNLGELRWAGEIGVLGEILAKSDATLIGATN
jgi:hypothetical protein